jgi:hypothetical protein
MTDCTASTGKLEGATEDDEEVAREWEGGCGKWDDVGFEETDEGAETTGAPFFDFSMAARTSSTNRRNT